MADRIERQSDRTAARRAIEAGIRRATGLAVLGVSLLGISLGPAPSSAQLAEVDRVTAALFAEGDIAGHAVAVHGDYAIVGAPETDVLGYPDTGVAYLLERDGSGVWSVVEKLVPSDAGGGTGMAQPARFGWAVDVDTSIVGTFAVVGAPWAREAGAIQAHGAVYVYERSASGWAEVAKLEPPTSGTIEEFGWSVALAGARVVVGAPFDSTIDLMSGAVYTFSRVFGVWQSDAKLIGSDLQEGSRFGHAVDVLGNDIIVAAPEGYTLLPGISRAYVYHGTPDPTPGSYTWTEDARLNPTVASVSFQSVAIGIIQGTSKRVAVVGALGTAGVLVYEDLGGAPGHVELPSAQIPPPASNTDFGRSVSLAQVGSSILLAVGEPLSDSSGPDRGRVHLYERTGPDVWTGITDFEAGDGAADDHFGESVSLSLLGGTARLLAGAPGVDVHGPESGSAYLVEDTPGGWAWIDRILPGDDDPLDRFGESVALDGGRMLVGAPGDEGHDFDAGGVYAFEESGGTWTASEKLAVPRFVEMDDAFGAAVALSGDHAIVGVPFDDDGGTDAGAVYFYERVGGVWTETDKLVASDATAGANLGAAVDIDGDLAIAGAPGANAAYVFRFYPGWFEVDKLAGVTPGLAPGDFGASVAIAAGRALVGDPGERSSGFPATYRAGGAYVFVETPPETWVQEARLGPPPPGSTAIHFGAAVATDGDVAVVGAPWFSSQSGRAYVWRRSGSSWSQTAALAPELIVFGAEFGHSVALDPPLVIVGERGLVGPGNAFAYFLVGSNAAPLFGSLPISGGVTGDEHGAAVSVDGFTVAVGAPAATVGETDAGATTLYVPEPALGGGLFAGLVLLTALGRVGHRRRCRGTLRGSGPPSVSPRCRHAGTLLALGVCLSVGSVARQAPANTLDLVFEKQVSVDGGVSYVDADSVASAAVTYLGFPEAVAFRILIANNEDFPVLIALTDATLGIHDLDLGVLGARGVVEIDSLQIPELSLGPPTTLGQFTNTAVFVVSDLDTIVEQFEDSASYEVVSVPVPGPGSLIALSLALVGAWSARRRRAE